MKNIKRALSLLIATMLALALPAETLAEGLYIEYDAAPSQVESAVIEAEESWQADMVQDEALAQAISDGETGENQTLSAAAIDADVPEAEELSLGDDEESSLSDDIIPEPSGLMPPSYVEDAESAEAVVTYRFIVGNKVVVTQAAKDGEEIVAPDDPTAPEGMVFAGWVLEDGTAVFEDGETVIAHTDPIVSEINVFAKFVAATADSASSDEDMSLEDEAVTGDAETASGDESSSGDENVTVENEESEPVVADETNSSIADENESSVDNEADADGNNDVDGNAEQEEDAEEGRDAGTDKDADAVNYADKDDETTNDADANAEKDAEAVNSADDEKDADKHTDEEEDNKEAVEDEEKADGQAEPSDDMEEDESSEDESVDDENNDENNNEDRGEHSDQESTIHTVRVVFNVTPTDAIVTVKAVNSKIAEDSADEAADVQTTDVQTADVQTADDQPTDETADEQSDPVQSFDGAQDTISEKESSTFFSSEDDGSFALLPGEYTYSVEAEGYESALDVPFTVAVGELIIDVALEAEEESSDKESGEKAEHEDDSDPVAENDPVEDADAENPPFDQSVTYNGVIISVKADAGTFPANATLSVSRVLLYEQRQADAAVDEIRGENTTVASSYTFDINVLDEAGNELQPTDGHKVQMSFAMAEVANENLETNVYHITDDITAEKLEVIDVDATTAMVVTNGFSIYAIEFTYVNPGLSDGYGRHLKYVLQANSEVMLSDIQNKLEMTGGVTNVVCSDTSLFTATRTDTSTSEVGEWIVKTLTSNAFSDETMTVTINGTDHIINVSCTGSDYQGFIDEIPIAVKSGDIYVHGIKWRIIGESDSRWLLILDEGINYDGYHGKYLMPYTYAQHFCKDLFEGFDLEEKYAVRATSKLEQGCVIEQGDLFPMEYESSEIDIAHLFLLSPAEATTYFGGCCDRAFPIDGIDFRWWLRSKYKYDEDPYNTYFGVVTATGDIYAEPWDNKLTAARPAFQLKRENILFTSAAADGKDSAIAANGDFVSFSDGYGSDRKLTLFDPSENSVRKDFQANVDGATSVTVNPGDSFALSYSGVGPYDHVSALLCKNGKTLYYATMAPDGTGKWEVTLPNSVVGSCTLKVFSEYHNIGYGTDYASPISTISITIANTFTIQLDKKGGSSGTSSVIATYGSPMPAIAPPLRTGYTFDGYFDSPIYGKQYYTATGETARNWEQTSDATLYAHWTALPASPTTIKGTTVGKAPDNKPGPNDEKSADPKPVSTDDQTRAPTSDISILATVKPGKDGTSLEISWIPLIAADGFDIFFTVCGPENPYQVIESVSATDLLDYTITGLKTGQCYKAYVQAWRGTKDNKTYVGKPSPRIHAIAGGSNKDRCNAKKVMVKKSTLRLKVGGKKRKIKASIVRSVRSKKVLKHVKKFRYYSTDRNVAIVSANGKVKPVAPGTCTIIVLANNGVYKEVSVTVK